MLRATRATVCAAICAMGLLALPSAAGASTYIDHFTLDSYHAGNSHATPPAVGAAKLVPGALYVFTVQGTLSYYSAINYVDPQPPWTVLCGTPEAAPQFASAGGAGEVGFDSEYVFARPWLPTPCAEEKLPMKWTNFQVHIGPGEWVHPTTLVPTTGPSPTHSYEYAFVAPKGRHLMVRLYDILTRDNYGSLRISTRLATTADCEGTKYTAFKLSSEAECVADVPLALKAKGRKHG